MKHLFHRILILSFAAGVLLSACGPETPPTESRHNGGLSAQPAPGSTADSTAVPPTADPTEAPTVEIGDAPLRTPVPTPDLEASTQTDLDRISFANPRLLQAPAEAGNTPLGLVAWSPDGKRFLADAFSDEAIWIDTAGYSLVDLYLADVTSGQISFLLHNGGWPAWSRDGESLYYLAMSSRDERVQYDLYRRSLADETSQLVIEDVGDPGTQPAVAELADGRLLLLDRDHQAAVFDRNEFVPLATLVDLPAPSGAGDNFSLAPDGTTVAIVSQNHPIYIVDLRTPALVATVDARVPFHDGVAWSDDGRQLAYTIPEGLFIYDLATGSTRSVVAREDMGIPSDDPSASLGLPAWSPDEKAILFAASTEDWTRTSKLGRTAAYQFAALVDGGQWKALSETLLNVAPNKEIAVTIQREPETDRQMLYVVDLTWN